MTGRSATNGLPCCGKANYFDTVVIQTSSLEPLHKSPRQQDSPLPVQRKWHRSGRAHLRWSLPARSRSGAASHGPGPARGTPKMPRPASSKVVSKAKSSNSPVTAGRMICDSNHSSRIVAEAANLPTTAEADEILEQKGISVLPDILTNAGGVIVSYYEWKQNLQQAFWDEEKVNTELQRYMTRAYADVATLAHQQRISPRRAAYQIGIERVARAESLRGV